MRIYPYWGLQRDVLSKLDEMLVRFSRLFGTGILQPHLQTATLLVAFAMIHSATFYTTAEMPLSLFVLFLLGLLGFFHENVQRLFWDLRIFSKNVKK